MDVDGETAPEPTATTSGQVGSDEFGSEIDDMLSAIGNLKRKLNDSTKVEAAHIARCKARVEHLISLGSYGTERALTWKGRTL